jgi:hypothetical protein
MRLSFHQLQKAFGMKKIIILSDTGEPRYGLVSRLKELFPECEIQILPHRSESIEEGMITEAKAFNLKKSRETVT